MKNLFFIITVLLLSSSLIAQDGVHYQAVVRDGNGDILTNNSVNLRFTIHQGTATGTAVYTETHSTNTDAYGLVNLSIGTGTVVSGVFNNIAWEGNSHFVEAEVNLGSGYTSVGTTKLEYVPYALFAKQAESAITDMDEQTLSIVGQVLTISNGNSINLPQGNDGDITAVTAGTGLTGGGTSGSVTINAQTSTALWNANKLQGRAVSPTAPTNNQILKWDGTAWTLSTDANNVYTAGAGLSLNGNQFSSLMTPGTGLTLAGNTLNSTWTSSGNNVYSNNTGNIGLGVTAPIDKLHLHGTNTASYLRITRPSSGVSSTDGLALGYNNTGAAYLLNAENTSMHFSTNNLVRMTIRNGGDVGIGTMSPTSPLHVYAATGIDPLRVQVAGATKLMVHDNGGLGVGSSTSSPPTDGLLVDGNVAIGVTTPQSRVHVSSASSTSESSIRFTRSTTGITSGDGFWFGYSSNSSNYMWGYENNNLSIGTNDVFRMTIQSDGDVGIGTASPSYDLQLGYNSAAKPSSSSWSVVSDSRLKDEVGNFTDGLDLVMKIRPIMFKYNGELGLPTEEIGIGTMAQELQAIAPYMVKSFTYKEGSAAGPEEPNETSLETREYLAIDYGALDFVLVNAIQEQQETITSQESEIQLLKESVERLLERIETLEAQK